MHCSSVPIAPWMRNHLLNSYRVIPDVLCHFGRTITQCIERFLTDCAADIRWTSSLLCHLHLRCDRGRVFRLCVSNLPLIIAQHALCPLKWQLTFAYIRGQVAISPAALPKPRRTYSHAAGSFPELPEIKHRHRIACGFEDFQHQPTCPRPTKG